MCHGNNFEADSVEARRGEARRGQVVREFRVMAEQGRGWSTGPDGKPLPSTATDNQSPDPVVRRKGNILRR